MATSASASTLPQQRAQAQQSVATATVVGDGARPQFWHAIAQGITVGVTVKAAEKTWGYATKTKDVVTKVKSVSDSSSESSSSSSESSSSSSGGPATSASSLHGVIPSDAQFDAHN